MTARRELFLAASFFFTGIINTSAGLVTVALTRNCLRSSEYVSNAAGFAAGLMCGFILNRVWTFRDQRRVTLVLPRYAAAFVASYLVNLAILALCLDWLGVPKSIAQAAALISYSVMFFISCRWFVFRSV